MFEKIDKEKNRRNALIGLILIAIPLIIYINNNVLRLPEADEVKNVEIIKNDIIIKSIVETGEIKTIISDLNKIHKKYLLLGNDPTKYILKIRLLLDDDKEYVIVLRDSTIEYDGHLYDIHPEEYRYFLNKYYKIPENI